MTRYANSALAAVAACVLTFGSIGAIVTVPPAQAETQPVIILPPLA